MHNPTYYLPSSVGTGTTSAGLCGPHGVPLRAMHMVASPQRVTDMTRIERNEIPGCFLPPLAHLQCFDTDEI